MKWMASLSFALAGLLAGALADPSMSAGRDRADSSLGGQSSQKPADKDKPADRQAALVNQLRGLLQPLGVTVEKASLLDVKKINVARDLVIRWDAYPGASEDLIPVSKVKDRPASKTMFLVKSEKRTDTLAELYGLDLSGEQLFIAGVNPKTELKWWTLIHDPRIIRGHSLGPNGEFIGEVYYRPRPEIFISSPDTDEITALWILQPKWTGAEFILELLSVINL